MKKILSIVIMSILVFSSAGAFAISIKEINSNILWGQKENNQVLFFDELDQEQPEQDWFGPVGPCALVNGTPNYILAQSFIPTKGVLTKVELMIVKNITATQDYTVAIRDNLSGADLTSVSIAATEISSENFSWEEFNFSDISVVPGNTYYILSSTVNVTDNWYAWGLKINYTTYPGGTVYYSINDEVTWTEIEEPGGDMTFRTYGIDNQAPEIPSIDGPAHGKVRKSLNFTFMSIDPDRDDVYYVVSWGCCENETHTYGPFASGEVADINHTWSKQGTFTIKVKANDTNGAESDWATFEIKVPRARNQFFLTWLFEKLRLLKQI